MVLYNFRKIQTVPSHSEFVDIVLSRTQRKTATVCHKGWKISRIRDFYLTKIKFTQQTYHDKLNQIIDEFPILDDIHPFYSDLMNVLYDRDHYKLALSQVNMAKSAIDRIASDYARMMKYGDSQYRCKQLKRAALGRMCTLMRRMGPSLAFLEEVRQHMSRLPSIDPSTRTLLVAGFPNVGKSSFLNKLTRADVEVQPYAFTTKSLFVGHMDYRYLRWQVIDTPGILDHSLEERNTIEMQSITALAHLRACILFFVDLSETCGYPIEQQMSLYNNLKPLFAGKPFFIIATKSDLKKMEELDPEKSAHIEAAAKDGVEVLTCSTMADEGVAEVKTKACDTLLDFRVEQKLKGKKGTDVLNRIHVAQPKNGVVRQPNIPQSVVKNQDLKKNGVMLAARRTERDLQEENGGAGVYYRDDRKGYDLKVPDWAFDVVPEIMDGKNIMDFIDPEILQRLQELEEEEAAREAALEEEEEEDLGDLDPEAAEALKDVRKTKKIIRANHAMNKSANHPRLPKRVQERHVGEFEETLEKMGVAGVGEALRKRGRSQSRARLSVGAEAEDMDMDLAGGKGARKRGLSVAEVQNPDGGKGMTSKKQKTQAWKMARNVQKERNKQGAGGDADRYVRTKMPQHLFAGKRTSGKTDRR
eukprot:GCRY01000346.1.p1 GENE.GCRY01000346.1~~GCRY01000346.1.p1  ORF type:complete len:737 (+),score=197.89 GCRY01000346.1:285-2213(+)